MSRMSPAYAKSRPPSFLSLHRAARAVTRAAQGTAEHRDAPPRSSPCRSEAAGSSVAAASHAWPLTFKSEVHCNETFSSLRAEATWRAVSGHVWLPTSALASSQNISIRTLEALGDDPPRHSVGAGRGLLPSLPPGPHSRKELEGQRLMAAPLCSLRNT